MPETLLKSAPAKLPPRVNVLGVGISAVNMEQALEVIDGWITTGQRHYICITGVHGVMESRRDPMLRDIHNRAGMVTPDGMPMVWMNRLYGQRHVSRVYGPDLMLALCGHSLQKGYRHYFYGGGDGVPELLTQRLTMRFPELQVVGHFSPPFRELTPQEDDAVVESINAAEPDIVWVGLSTPKQERWMASHQGRLNVPALIGVGAAFDFHAGLVRQAPKWMQRSGMEWFFRTMMEPKRLWKRYFTNNPRFVMLALMQLLGLKSFQLNA